MLTMNMTSMIPFQKKILPRSQTLTRKLLDSIHRFWTIEKVIPWNLVNKWARLCITLTVFTGRAYIAYSESSVPSCIMFASALSIAYPMAISAEVSVLSSVASIAAASWADSPVSTVSSGRDSGQLLCFCFGIINRISNGNIGRGIDIICSSFNSSSIVIRFSRFTCLQRQRFWTIVMYLLHVAAIIIITIVFSFSWKSLTPMQCFLAPSKNCSSYSRGLLYFQ